MRVPAHAVGRDPRVVSTQRLLGRTQSCLLSEASLPELMDQQVDSGTTGRDPSPPSVCKHGACFCMLGRSRASPVCPEVWPRSFAFSSQPAARGRASQPQGEGPVGEATCLRLRPAVGAWGRRDRPRSGFDPNSVPFTPKSDQCLFPSSHSSSSCCLNNVQSVKKCSVSAPIANGIKSKGRQSRRVSLGLRVTQSLEPRVAAVLPQPGRPVRAPDTTSLSAWRPPVPLVPAAAPGPGPGRRPLLGPAPRSAAPQG